MRGTIWAIGLCAGLAGCGSSSDAISNDPEPFSAIAPDEGLKLIGTEPFWNMTIGPSGGGYEARFSTPEGEAPGSPFALQRFAGNNGLGFNGQMNGTNVQIAVTPGKCSDQMSDRAYAYFATIVMGDEMLSGCAMPLVPDTPNAAP